MLFRFMTRAADRLKRDIADAEARADAGEDVTAELPGLARRANRWGLVALAFERLERRSS